MSDPRRLVELAASTPGECGVLFVIDGRGHTWTLYSPDPDYPVMIAPVAHTVYWAHVYLRRDKATAGVEIYAERGGHGAVRWEEHSPVWYAYPANGMRTRELYRVVPLRVHRDDQPEP